jgi:hypothetical protein
MALLETEVEDAIREPGPCILCSEKTPSFGIGVFRPPMAQEMGAEPGGSVMTVYRLCGACHTEEAIGKVEDVILRRHRGATR